MITTIVDPYCVYTPSLLCLYAFFGCYTLSKWFSVALNVYHCETADRVATSCYNPSLLGHGPTATAFLVTATTVERINRDLPNHQPTSRQLEHVPSMARGDSRTFRSPQIAKMKQSYLAVAPGCQGSWRQRMTPKHSKAIFTGKWEYIMVNLLV